MINVILLFTRILSRFRSINKFKPLLYAYQGSYQTDFYYWTGLLLMIRVMLFGISSLDRQTNVGISIIFISMIIGFHGTVEPFKFKYKNYQDLLLFFNLQVLYVISLYDQNATNITVINIMFGITLFVSSSITSSLMCMVEWSEATCSWWLKCTQGLTESTPDYATNHSVNSSSLKTGYVITFLKLPLTKDTYCTCYTYIHLNICISLHGYDSCIHQ